jgi:hypothetical protein
MPNSADDLRSEVALLRAEVAALRAERARPGPAPDGDTPVSRRALFGKLAGVAAAGVGLSAVLAEPAAAAVGGNFILGQGNDSVGEGSSLHNVSSESTLDVYNGGTGSALFVDTTSTTSTAPALVVRTNNKGPCIDAGHLNTENYEPVVLVTGSSSGVGVRSTAGTGVYGISNSGGAGVIGETTGGQGIYGYATDGRAVYGYANSGDGIGVTGYSNGKYGVWAWGAQSQLMLEPMSAAGAPTAGAHSKGEVLLDAEGTLWQCILGGSPGTWAKPGYNAVTPTKVMTSVSIGAALYKEAAVRGIAGVPAAAKAAAISVSARADASTYLTLFGNTRPSLPHVHVAPQYTWDTSAIVPLSSTGKLRVYNRTGTAVVTAYVTGYFL